mmetsp:Transcript_11304/g.19363  ORF Transcript_11304/g.19363 Transcript_11304/m.19363 type:complete len:231 (-) Transcript_11304:373-1065(-)
MAITFTNRVVTVLKSIDTNRSTVAVRSTNRELVDLFASIHKHRIWACFELFAAKICPRPILCWTKLASVIFSAILHLLRAATHKVVALGVAPCALAFKLAGLAHLFNKCLTLCSLFTEVAVHFIHTRTFDPLLTVRALQCLRGTISGTWSRILCWLRCGWRCSRNWSRGAVCRLRRRGLGRNRSGGRLRWCWCRFWRGGGSNQGDGCIIGTVIIVVVRTRKAISTVSLCV